MKKLKNKLKKIKIENENINKIYQNKLLYKEEEVKKIKVKYKQKINELQNQISVNKNNSAKSDLQENDTSDRTFKNEPDVKNNSVVNNFKNERKNLPF